MLKTKDMFILSAIVDKMGLDEDIKGLLGNKGDEVDESAIGRKLLFSIAKKLYKAEDEVILLLSNATGKPKKDIEDLPPKETLELIKNILQEQGVMDFLSQQAED